jgi:RNA 2',3'-cyclic 3'-phosphodiesterase
VRLFVALELPGEVREALADLTARLKPLSLGAKWASPKGMHVTLKFIGHAIADDDAEKFTAARVALARVKSDSPVNMIYRSIGFFPNARRPNVLWCGVQASPNLASVVADMEKVLAPLGIPAESRPYVPHLTLARFKSPEGVTALVRAAEEFAEREFGSSRETQFHLFESKLKPGGAEHRKIESYAFVRTAA